VPETHPRIAAFLADLETALEARRLPAGAIVAEAEGHLAESMMELASEGLTWDAAAEEAIRRFGSIEHVANAWSRRRGVGRPVSSGAPRRLLQDLGAEVRYGARKLLASPGFTIATAAILAIGIGATTAMFSLVNAVLFSPLPFQEPDRLVRVFLRHDWGGETRYSLSEADFTMLREQTVSLQSVAALYVRGSFQIVGAEEPIRVAGARVSAEFFTTLGVRPLLGRFFQAGDDRPGQAPRVVISHRLWRGYLKSDREIVGSSLTVDGQAHTVVGVLPPDFRWARAEPVEVWPVLPVSEPENRAPFFLTAFGRLKPGVSARELSAELPLIAGAIRRRYPSSPSDWAFGVEEFRELFIRRSRPVILLLSGSVAALLLVACANVANLLLTRALGRRPELAVLTALGASPWRLARQLLVESLLLACAGGALGLALASYSLGPLLELSEDTFALPRDAGIDPGVLLFATALVGGVTLGVGLVPALRSAGGDSAVALKQAASSMSDGPAPRRLRAVFAALQVALATTLLIGAGLLLRSFHELSRVATGARLDGVLAVPAALPGASYPDASSVDGFWEVLLDRVRRLPGVVDAAASMALPPDLLVMTNPMSVEGRPASPGQTPPLVEQLLVSPRYFGVLGIPVREGRDFTLADRADTAPVVIVNETLSHRFFPAGEALGRRLQLGDPRPDGTWYTVVGVVADVKYAGLDAGPASTVYVSYFQERWWREMYLVVRTAQEPLSVAPLVRAEIAALDPSLAPGEPKTLNRIVAESLAAPRFRTALLVGFGCVALALAGLGVYGVVAQAVASRTREIAIRRAVGASDRNLLAHVLREGMAVVLVGALGGVGASLVLSRALTALLFQVLPGDPTTLIGAPLLLGAVGWLACYLPARRALGVEPLIALRAG